MKTEFRGNVLTVTREPGDKRYYGNYEAKGESNFLHDLKKYLNYQGYDLIKKRMWKDGHLVDDMQQYLRTRKKGAGKADVYILNHMWAIMGANDAFNKGSVDLMVDYNVFENE